MTSRAAKRKRYTDIKNMLVNDLHKVTVDSGDLNNDLLEANQDFGLMFKSIEDRQNVLLSRALLMEEKYREITALVKDGKHTNVGESSSAGVELPPSYAADVRKFVDDSSASLRGHAKLFTEHMEEMVEIFKKYGKVWETKLDEFKGHAEGIEEEVGKLGNQLADLMRNI